MLSYDLGGSVELYELMATAIMTGVIWVVQIVCYPLFLELPPNTLKSFHREYTKRISWVVIPLMMTEIVLAFMVGFKHQRMGLDLIFLILAWGTTFFVSVPLHRQIEVSGEAKTSKKLVNTNWIRTSFWTFRFCLLSFRFVKGL